MTDRVAAGVPDIELADYQRAFRTVLRHPLISSRYPDAAALPLVRRWSTQLRADLAAALGYRLELTASSARLIRTIDDLDSRRPARTRSGRVFDRRRYAYLALVLAALGRAGIQVTLSELADVVAADANRIARLGLDTGRGPHRAAFVDVVTWLEERGALRLADGSARAWADDPGRAEALYDIDRDVALAVHRPGRVLNHLGSVTGLLARDVAAGRDSGRRDAGQRARRALVEQPVVLVEEVDAGVRNVLRTSAIIADVTRLTGCAVERRAEGLALIDTAGLAERRFPASGTVAQAALLLLGALADRVADVDDAPLPLHIAPPRSEVRDALAAEIDRGRPVGDLLVEFAGERGTPAQPQAGGTGSGTDAEGDTDVVPTGRPLVGDGWLAATMAELVTSYSRAFGAEWRADPPRLLAAALDVLAAHRFVEPVPGGVLVLPLVGRYRNVVVRMRPRRSAGGPSLFDPEDLA
ncbi:DUF2398 family protein [Pseudonocardia sp.]|uniref:DUF2398 family protein n=1 Tax=Pseudonocardia sp. TaxID=60912 RepID=UPI003D120FEF